MDEITKVKTQIRMEQWVLLIKECQSSGRPVNTWCKQNNVKEASYYYWLKKIRKAACTDYSPSVQPNSLKQVEFAKLQVDTRKPDTQAAVVIHLPVATIEVADGTSQQTVEAVLLALKNIC